MLSMLIPILGGAKEVAWGVSCQSNLRQMGVAWEAVIIENAGRVPLTVSPGKPQWDTLMMEVTGLTWGPDEPAIACPIAAKEYGSLEPRPTSYAVNVLWDVDQPEGDNEGQPWGGLVSPSTYPLFSDPAARMEHNPPIILKHMGRAPGPDWRMGFIHPGETSAVAYGDGHVAFENRGVLEGPTDSLGRPLWLFNRDPFADIAALPPLRALSPPTLEWGS
ncbi:MAG: hypothetical protein AAF797_17590 [Planctomycetota bacterium]